MSQGAPVTKVWQKSVNRYWRYSGNIKLPRESWTDARTHRRMHGQRHGRTTQKHIASAGAYRQRRLKHQETVDEYIQETYRLRSLRHSGVINNATWLFISVSVGLFRTDIFEPAKNTRWSHKKIL